MSEVQLQVPFKLRAIRRNDRGTVFCSVPRSDGEYDNRSTRASRCLEWDMRERGYILLHESSGDFSSGAYFNRDAINKGMKGEVWADRTLFVNLYSGQVFRVNARRQRMEKTRTIFKKGAHDNMKASVEEALNQMKFNRPHIVDVDYVKRITVDGKAAVLLDCAKCGRVTPHGLQKNGKKYCGICGVGRS